MMTIRDLCDQLAAALGMSERALAYVASDLANAEMIGGIDEQATIEDSARILVAAVGDFDVRAPWCAVRNFWDLPLTSLQIMEETESTVSWGTLKTNDPYAADIREFFGDTFGSVLANVIADSIWLSAPAITGNIGFSSSPGRTFASIKIEIGDRIVLLWFDRSIAADDGAAPHGLPPASPLRTVEIPAAIFEVLRDALAGAAHPWVTAWANEHDDQADELDQENWRN